MLYAHISIAVAETAAPATQPDIPATGFDPLAPLLDPHQWMLVQAAPVQFAEGHPIAWVQLFKSIEPIGTDGTGRPQHAVNLVVGENGRLLYSFGPAVPPPFDSSRTGAVFYMDDRGIDAGGPLEVRDVTGDRVPEIIFHSGWAGASDSETDNHVLQYTDIGTTKVRDVRDPHFIESWWQRFRWLDLDGRTVAIVAESVEPSTDPERTCHGCPKFHQYQVYRWDSLTSRFALSETIPSTGELHAGDRNPFQIDWTYIEARLGKTSNPP